MIKAILFRLAAILISLTIVALVLEVALRLFASDRLRFSVGERNFFCRFDHELGWAPLENTSGMQIADNKRFLIHQNQFGLRGSDELKLEKTSARKRVLVLGDSYVWGLGATQDDIFTNPKVYGTDDEFINCGVSGFGTDQEYLFYLRTGQKFDVDQVVLVFTPYNDIENNLASKQYSHLKPFFTLNGGELVLHNEHVVDTPIRTFFSRLNRESRVCNLVGEGYRGLTNVFLPKRSRLEPDVVVTDADRAGIELTLAILKKLKEAVAAHHAEFYVIFIPYKPNVQRHLPDNHPFVPLIAAGLTEMGVSYREPYPEFLKSAMAGADPFNMKDNHFNAAGHALFAKFVTDTDLARASIDYYAHH